MLFSGKSNSIMLTREYYQDYSCSFDLKYYPFDTQVYTILLYDALESSIKNPSYSSAKWNFKSKAKPTTT